MYDENVIVVEFVTALTFTTVSKINQILWVNIVPGLQTSISSLYKNTAKLPKINLSLPEKVIGKNTIHSIQGGIMYGYVGLIKELIFRIMIWKDRCVKKKCLMYQIKIKIEMKIIL